MDTKKFELELKDYDSAVLTAEKSFQIHDYSKSVSDYQVALAKAKALFRPTSEQVIGCTLGLADSYFENNSLDHAQQLYEELLVAYSQISDVNAEEVVKVMFKLAKIADKKSDVTVADVAFNRVLRQAETNLDAAHPLCGAIFEAYANFLQRTQLKPEVMQQLLHKASLARALRAGNKKSKTGLSLSSASRRAAEPDSRSIETAADTLKENSESEKHRIDPAKKRLFVKVAAAAIFVGTFSGLLASRENVDHTLGIGCFLVATIFLGAAYVVGPPQTKLHQIDDEFDRRKVIRATSQQRFSYTMLLLCGSLLMLAALWNFLTAS